jgi:hypothetical protein
MSESGIDRAADLASQSLLESAPARTWRHPGAHRPCVGRRAAARRFLSGPPCGGLAAILLPLAAALEPDKTFVELRNMASNGTIDPLHEFSSICREEFEDIQAQQF